MLMIFTQAPMAASDNTSQRLTNVLIGNDNCKQRQTSPFSGAENFVENYIQENELHDFPKILRRQLTFLQIGALSRK